MTGRSRKEPKTLLGTFPERELRTSLRGETTASPPKILRPTSLSIPSIGTLVVPPCAIGFSLTVAFSTAVRVLLALGTRLPIARVRSPVPEGSLDPVPVLFNRPIL